MNEAGEKSPAGKDKTSVHLKPLPKARRFLSYYDDGAGVSNPCTANWLQRCQGVGLTLLWKGDSNKTLAGQLRGCNLTR